jgi:FkbM family methyltransferase
MLMVNWSRLHRLRIHLGLTPFSEIQTDSDGVAFLKARVKTPLAARGEVIAIPKDRMIYSYVKNYGQWGTTEARFLENVVIHPYLQSSTKILLIDLGAHAGLVSKIFLDKLPDADIETILVDPLSKNIKAQVFNLKRYATRIKHCPKAISFSSGLANFEIDSENIGASRLSNAVQISDGDRNILVETISIPDFETKYLHGNSRSIVLKSDLEGIDAKILNSFSDQTWSRIIGGVFEFDSTSVLNADEINALAEKLSQFRTSFDANMSTVLSEIDFRSIWISDQRLLSNLYFVRTGPL